MCRLHWCSDISLITKQKNNKYRIKVIVFRRMCNPFVSDKSYNVLVWRTHHYYNGDIFINPCRNVYHIPLQLYHKVNEGPPNNTGEYFSL